MKGWVIILAAIGLAFLLHAADMANTAVVAPYLDQISLWIQYTFPFLRYTHVEIAWLACAAVAIGWFFLCSVIVLIVEWFPSSGSNQLGVRLKKRKERERKNEEGNGFAE